MRKIKALNKIYFIAKFFGLYFVAECATFKVDYPSAVQELTKQVLCTENWISWEQFKLRFGSFIMGNNIAQHDRPTDSFNLCFSAQCGSKPLGFGVEQGNKSMPSRLNALVRN